MNTKTLCLKRTYKGTEYTVGHLYYGGTMLCDTLEDRVRQLPRECPDTPHGRMCRCREKVYAATAIPPGTYALTYSYSPKFRRRMLRLQGVPHFLGILIHGGTTAASSAGCILVGRNTRKGMLTQSAEALASVERLVTGLIADGCSVILRVE